MKCPNCGTKAEAGEKFCFRCGTKLETAQEEVPVSSPAEIPSGKKKSPKKKKNRFKKFVIKVFVFLILVVGSVVAIESEIGKEYIQKVTTYITDKRKAKGSPSSTEEISSSTDYTVSTTRDTSSTEKSATRDTQEDKTSINIKSTENQENTALKDTQSIKGIIQTTELEFNDTIEESNIIETNKQYQGQLSSDKDVDYYKFRVETSGKINIMFEHEKIDSSDRLWEICLLDGNSDEEIIQFYSIGGTTKGESDTARISAGEYYIKVGSYNYSDKDYLFTVNFFEESDIYEKENNNEIDSANTITVGTNYTGNMETDKDVDYYKFSVKNKGKINITFKHEKMDEGKQLWKVYLLDGVNDDTIISFSSSGKEAVLQSDSARIPAGDYYLKINSFYYSNKDYSFTVNFENET